MPQNINVLIVDDHPFIIQGYTNVITRFPVKKFEFTITKALNCKEGYDAIVNQGENKFDLVMFDISMPEYPDEGIKTGEDLARLVKRDYPDCKVMLLTMHSERLKAEKIIDEIDPIGLIIKNDLTYDNMILALKTVLKNERYYSISIINFLNSLQNGKVYVDALNRQILQQLNKGVKPDDVALYVPLSSSQVKTRIDEMKILIGKKGCKTEDLLKEARINGMLNT
jgi:DNA-binding NarL/FixJ family response regulator